ncbi:Isoleucyl-tRNA synthetase [hydrothermal vent metagenome]|uniref:isoleucine--tRNA ligase n=1 Tax=hydrothermal vent metagenome TaxID=652676 RepID=A0A3B1DAZ6_9ZZZZ
MDKLPSYKESLNLPQTDFPMRAQLAQREVTQLEDWESVRLYDEIQKRHASHPPYILHDGPPYANGHIHIGHALNKILKDIIIKSKSMSGFRTPYVPGWDCHGLPIEHQVLKKLGSKKREMSKIEIRQKCRESALHFVKIQKEEFKRLGIFGDWENPYLTLTPDYEAAIVREFAKVFASGGVYKGKKPVLWCSSDETALAEAEVEYADKVSPSIYVKFKIKDALGRLSEADAADTSFVIWTTTPWTLVANKAISLNPGLKYCLIKTPTGKVILAEDLVDVSMKAFGFSAGSFEVTDQHWLGEALEGMIAQHPFLDQTSPIILGEHVTLEQGTGCVHTAPGHGQEDYEVGLRYNLEVYAPVNHYGKFTEEAGAFAGLKVVDANKKIIETLKDKNALLSASEISHSYPHCWRCKKPVIFRATEQWFISMAKNDLRTRALKSISKDVKWIPKWGQDRIEGMVTNRPDWCISRQRVWGVPIVAFGCLGCHKPFSSETIIKHVADLMETTGEGSDLWFSKSADALLPEGTVCPECGGTSFQQEQDILDVWFESGVSHAAVLKARANLSWPADLYLEGSDQHRGWFHSTMLASLMTDDCVPYKTVLTHGFVMDGAGKKMSKSLGNVIAPQEIIKQNGADILRLWVAATDFSGDMRISPDILKQVAEAYRKIRNTCRFLLGNLHDFSVEESLYKTKVEDFQEIDFWALDKLNLLNEKVQGAYDESTFHVVFHAINNFCAVDLSAFYLDILKDRLYASAKDAPERRIAQSVMQEILMTLVRLMAPILSFTAEEIWRNLPKDLKVDDSVHLTTFPKIQKVDPKRLQHWEGLLQVREAVSLVLETARKERKIGNSLQATVSLEVKEALYEKLQKHAGFLAEFFIVSKVHLRKWKTGSQTDRLQETEWVFQNTVDALGLKIQVTAALGEKCARCWIYREDLGTQSAYPTLCKRCTEVVISEHSDAS